ncbi:hypothetical protein V8F44DRAFT_662273 [Aspergillus fumigatus]
MLSSLSLEELISWSVSGSDERGFMVSVNATCKKLAQLVAAVNARRHEDYVEVACYNGPRKYVLVESAAAIHFLEVLVATNQDFQGSVRVKAELARGLNWCDPVVHLKTCIETQSYDGPISTGTYTKTGVFEQAVGRLTERLPECAWLEAGHGSSAVQILRDFLGTSAEQQIKNHHWLPFVKTTGTATPTNRPEAELGRADHEFINFAGYGTDSTADLARVHVDPEKERTHVSRTEELQMKTTIALNTGKYIVLHLQPVPGPPFNWEFRRAGIVNAIVNPVLHPHESQEFMVCTGIDRIETGVPAYLVFEKCKRANGGIKNSAKALTIATGRTPSALPAQTAIGEGYQPVLIAARRMFKHVPELEYYVLDIERELLAKDLSSFHVITSTNCIHATQNLMNSLSKIRKMLHIAVYLFEGWWVFMMGANMRDTGLTDVAWTSGEEPETNTIRIIGGFAGSG